MSGNDRAETASTEVTLIRRRNDIENPLRELIDILPILKVESKSKYPCRIDVIISPWIRL